MILRDVLLSLATKAAEAVDGPWVPTPRLSLVQPMMMPLVTTDEVRVRHFVTMRLHSVTGRLLFAASADRHDDVDDLVMSILSTGTDSAMVALAALSSPSWRSIHIEPEGEPAELDERELSDGRTLLVAAIPFQLMVED